MDRLRLGFILNLIAGFAILIASAFRSSHAESWASWYPLAFFFFALSGLYYIRWKRGR
ncbi:MAG: hypothetical protein RLN79_01320 [Cytophagales bacterium]